MKPSKIFITFILSYPKLNYSFPHILVYTRCSQKKNTQLHSFKTDPNLYNFMGLYAYYKYKLIHTQYSNQKMFSTT